MKTKKLLSLLLTLALLLTLLPIAAAPALAADSYPLWIAGVQFTSENLVIDPTDTQDITAGKATYDPSAHTLTLEGFTYSGTGLLERIQDSNNYSQFGLYYDSSEDLTIVLVGDNTLTLTELNQPGSQLSNSYGARFYRTGGSKNPKLTVYSADGAGSLHITGGHCTGFGAGLSLYHVDLLLRDAALEAVGGTSGNNSLGVNALYSAIEVAGGGRLTARAGAAVNHSYGLQGYYPVRVTGGRLEAYGGTGTSSCGILLYNNSNAVLTVTDGLLIVQDDQQAIWRDGSASLSLDGMTILAGGSEATATEKQPAEIENTAYPYVKIFAKYPLWVGSAQFTFDNLVIDHADDPLITAGKATYDPGAYTLTLDAFTYAGGGHGGAAIYYGGASPLTIALVGNNSVRITTFIPQSYGVYAEGNSVGALTFTGAGRLEAAGGPAAAYSAGIFSNGAVSFTGCEVYAVGGAVDGESPGHSAGVIAGRVSVTGGTVTAIGGRSVPSNPTQSNEKSKSNGVFASGRVSVTGGTLNATGGAAKEYSNGIRSASVSISGGTVYAVGGDADDNSCGIYGYDGSDAGVAISGSARVDAQSGKAKDCYGIYGRGSGVGVRISGATAYAVGGDADDTSAGIYGYGRSAGVGIELGGSARVAARSGKADDSFGIYGYSESGFAISFPDTSTAWVEATADEAWLVSCGIYANSASNGSAMNVDGCEKIIATGGKVTSGVDNMSAGVFVMNDGTGIHALHISKGTLIASGGENTSVEGMSCGICGKSQKDTLHFTGTAQVEAYGGKALKSAGKSFGIYGESDHEVGKTDDNSVVYAACARVYAVGADAMSISCGINGVSNATRDGVRINGGSVTALAGKAELSDGIRGGNHGYDASAAGVRIANAVVRAVGDQATARSTGISGSTGENASGVVASGGKVYAVAADAENSYGVYGKAIGTGTGVVLDGAAVEAWAGKNTDENGGSAGVYGETTGTGDGVSISAGSVYAVGADANSSNGISKGVYGRSSGGSGVSITGGTVFAAGGDAAISYGINAVITSTGTPVTIAGGDYIEARGKNAAVMGNVKNAVAGLGWTDDPSTEAPIPIAQSPDSVIDRSGFKVVCFPAEHTAHDFVYTASGDTITATCTRLGCTAAAQTLTVVPPADAPANGTARTATLTIVGTVFGSPTIVYTQGNTVLPGAPSEAGDYTASVTVAGVTASAGFTILPAEPQQQEQQPQQPSYDYGEAAPATYPPVVAQTTGGTVEVSPARPTRGATVTVALLPAEGYEAVGVSVTDARGADVATQAQPDGTWQFTQPGSKVTIEAAFQPAAPDAPAPAVVLSPQKITINGVEATVEAYNIGGTNFFRLRDLAALLKSTPAQFNVEYDEEANAVRITTGAAYTGEVNTDFTDQSATALPSPQTIYVDGAAVALTAYNIGGYNFFGLRELAALFGYAVGYDAATNTAIIESK